MSPDPRFDPLDGADMRAAMMMVVGAEGVSMIGENGKSGGSVGVTVL